MANYYQKQLQIHKANNMEIIGKVVAVLELQSGTSKKGSEWKKRDFVIETLDEKFPKKVCFTLFGDRADACPPINSVVNVAFDIDAHEYNGKWFNSVNAWKVEPAQAQQQAAPQQAAPAPRTSIPPQQAATAPVANSNPAPSNSSSTDLPF